MRHESVLVTAKMAQEMLARPYVRQRTISRTHVTRYGRAMIEGRWNPHSPVPICITPAGELLNGQHRLLGLLAGQFLAGPNATVAAGAARVVLWYDKRFLQSDGFLPPSGGAMAFDEDELLAFAEGPRGHALRAAVALAVRVQTAIRLPGAAHAAALFVAAREGTDPDRLEEWVEGLASGANLDADDPRLLLRNRITDPIVSAQLRRDGAAVWQLTVRALNAFLQGRALKRLARDANDPLPVVDPTGKADKTSRDRFKRRREQAAKHAEQGVLRSVSTTRMAASGKAT